MQFIKWLKYKRCLYQRWHKCISCVDTLIWYWVHANGELAACKFVMMPAASAQNRICRPVETWHVRPMYHSNSCITVRAPNAVTCETTDKLKMFAIQQRSVTRAFFTRSY